MKSTISCATVRRCKSISVSLFACIMGWGAFLTLGCAEVTDGDSVEATDGVASAEQAIVGGTATLLRPQTGQYSNSGSCTATLISPQYFVIASHCAWHQPSLAGGTLTFQRNLNGTTQSISRSVSWIHSYFGSPCTVGGSIDCLRGGTWDIALGRLATAVPTDWPIGYIHYWRAWPDETVTAVGYGCNVRSPESGAGTKRYATGSYGDTDVLCHGDSGGPLYFGAITDDTGLVGVNSARGDTFADIVHGQNRIMAEIRKLENGLEPGFNRGGADYSNFTLSASTATDGANQCRTACLKGSACNAFTYVHSDRRCWLKYAAQTPTGVADPTVISGVAEGTGAFDLPGGDYSWFASASGDDCQAACGRDSNCKAYTYYAGTCWLKNSVPAATTCAACASGIRRGRETNVDRPYEDIQVISASPSIVACQNSCSTNGQCLAYSYVASSRTCYLKSAQPGISDNAAVVSGVRRGVEANTDRPGGDYRSFVQSEPRPEACQAACASESQCRAWTLVTAPAGDSRCWLKSSIPGATTVLGVLSGRKGLDFF